MASHGAVLALRPDLIAAPGLHEGIHTHGTIQLGLKMAGQPLAFNEAVTLAHGPNHPPLFNLALEPGPALPAFLSALTITPGPPQGFTPPGPGVAPFLPGILPVMPQVLPLPLAPLDPFTAWALAALHVPGGFAHYSNTFTSVHTFNVAGAVNEAVPAGLYRYDFYVTAALAPAGLPRIKVCKYTIAAQVQAA